MVRIGLTKISALESILLKTPEQREVITAVKNAVGPVWSPQCRPQTRSIMLMNAKDVGHLQRLLKLMQIDHRPDRPQPPKTTPWS